MDRYSKIYEEDLNEPMVEVGAEIRISRVGVEDSEDVLTTLVERGDGGWVLKGDTFESFVKSGSILKLKLPTEPDFVGWARVQITEQAAETTIWRVAKPRWEFGNDDRAQRLECKFRVTATWVEKDLQGQDTKRTTGQTINLSVSGTRIKMRTPLVEGTITHLQIHLPSDKLCEALAQVKRIVKGSEANGGGFDIGMTFLRFLSGYDDFLGTLDIKDEGDREVA